MTFLWAGLISSIIYSSCNQPKEIEQPLYYGFGRAASTAEIDSLDIDISPDGKGLPIGSGISREGRKIYVSKCAVCHGANGVEGPFNALVTSDNSKAKTIGNYWPYATTLFDYIRRTMPFNQPGSLNNEEVYHLVAYLLHANKIIDSTLVIDANSLPGIVMPAHKLFKPDDRNGGDEIK